MPESNHYGQQNTQAIQFSTNVLYLARSQMSAWSTIVPDMHDFAGHGARTVTIYGATPQTTSVQTFADTTFSDLVTEQVSYSVTKEAVTVPIPDQAQAFSPYDLAGPAGKLVMIALTRDIDIACWRAAIGTRRTVQVAATITNADQESKLFTYSAGATQELPATQKHLCVARNSSGTAGSETPFRMNYNMVVKLRQLIRKDNYEPGNLGGGSGCLIVHTDVASGLAFDEKYINNDFLSEVMGTEKGNIAAAKTEMIHGVKHVGYPADRVPTLEEVPLVSGVANSTARIFMDANGDGVASGGVFTIAADEDNNRILCLKQAGATATQVRDSDESVELSRTLFVVDKESVEFGYSSTISRVKYVDSYQTKNFQPVYHGTHAVGATRLRQSTVREVFMASAEGEFVPRRAA